MNKVVELRVAKETSEAAQALANVAKVTIQALSDGFQPADVAAIAAVAVTEFAQAVQGASDIPAEFRDDPEAATNAVYVALAPVVFELAVRP
jgi:hypothetical protein